MAHYVPFAQDGHYVLAALVAGGVCFVLAGVLLVVGRGSANPAPETTAGPVPLAPPEPTRRVGEDIIVAMDGPVIDEAALESLLKLGGEAFLDEVISQFVSESVLLLLRMAQAVAEKDAAEYAAHVHALRSSAANVGAKRLYGLCLAWRELSPEELAASGAARFVMLQKEFQSAERMLTAWRNTAPGGMTPAALAG